MRELLTIIFCLLVIGWAVTYERADAAEGCDMIGQLYEAIALKRDSGVPQEELKDRFDGDTPEDRMFRDVVRAVYARQDLTRNQISQWVYHRCLEERGYEGGGL